MGKNFWCSRYVPYDPLWELDITQVYKLTIRTGNDVIVMSVTTEIHQDPVIGIHGVDGQGILILGRMFKAGHLEAMASKERYDWE